MTFFCLADEDTVRGFRLAGVEGRAAANAAEAAAALADLCERPDCGILIVSSPVAALVQAQIDGIRNNRERPLIVEVPVPTAAAPARRRLSDLVQQAVGIMIDTEAGP